MKQANETRITMRFPSALVEALQPIALQNGRSLTSEVLQAVREHLKRQKAQA
jgi:predicted transcriptional regulator